jgi:hypothetical protein
VLTVTPVRGHGTTITAAISEWVVQDITFLAKSAAWTASAHSTALHVASKHGISEFSVQNILKHYATTGRYYSTNTSQRGTGTTHPLRDGSIPTEEKEEIVSEIVAFLDSYIRARLADGKVSTLKHLAKLSSRRGRGPNL